MRKKKLLILSSYGGYGHIAATNTLKKLLNDDYEIEVVYPIKELRMYRLPDGESFYNWLLANNFTGATNWLVKFLPHFLFSRRVKKTVKIIQDHIERKQADLLISLIPFINFPASEAARLCDIPFLLITTDNDLVNWVYGMEKMQASRFKVTIGSHLETTSGLLREKGISESAIEEIGLPLRPDFIHIEDKKAMRDKYGIPDGKNVVLVMMGGAGSSAIVQYVKVLVSRSMDLHVIVCAGRNRRLAKRLKKLQPATGNSVDVIPFTEKIHELLSLSDLLITKPGPGSVNEAYQLRLPILLDWTNPPLFWERANIDLVLRDGVGACIQNFREAPEIVARFLFDEQTIESVNRAYIGKKENRFARAIKPLIEEITASPATGEVAVTGRNLSNIV